MSRTATRRKVALPENMHEQCTLCGTPIWITRTILNQCEPVGKARRLGNGVLYIGDLDNMPEAVYCPPCAEGVATCRVCGCTNETPCEDGCWWIEPDLCSSCRPATPERLDQ